MKMWQILWLEIMRGCVIISSDWRSLHYPMLRYYRICRKDLRTFLNLAQHFSITNSTLDCYNSNNETKCDFKLTKLRKASTYQNGYFLGWKLEFFASKIRLSVRKCQGFVKNQVQAFLKATYTIKSNSHNLEQLKQLLQQKQNNVTIFQWP